MAVVTCKQCKSKIDKSDAIKVKDRTYFCSKECSDKWDREHEKKEKSENDGDYQLLIKYVCQLYGVKSPTMVWLAQIKRFHENKNMKYGGMLLALKYYYETLGNAVNFEYGLGILEWVYDDAKEHYLKTKEIEKLVSNMDLEDEEIVVVKKLDKSTKPKYNIDNIDMEG